MTIEVVHIVEFAYLGRRSKFATCGDCQALVDGRTDGFAREHALWHVERGDKLYPERGFRIHMTSDRWMTVQVTRRGDGAYFTQVLDR